MTEYEPSDSESSEEWPCPWDGCERTLSTERGLKTHHAQIHDESLAGVDIECANCGTPKNIKPSRVERSENHFCNRQCQNEWRSENKTGENSHTWNGGLVTTTCAWCGTPKEVKPFKVERSKRNFCDARCEGDWLAENRSGENSWNWDGGLVTVACAWCGSEKQVFPANAEEYDDHYCRETNCQEKWLAKNNTGEANPNWEGGSFPYGSGFTEAKKEKVRERQDRRCAGCGTHESEFSRKLDVHHIQKARSFDDDEARNDKSNLVAMCQPCHLEKWEGIPLRPQTPLLDD